MSLPVCLRPRVRRSIALILYVFGGLLFIALLANRARAEDSASDDAEAARRAAAAFRLPKEFTVKLFAAKPQLFNPVAICLDERGRVFVAEDHRFLEGTPENRSHSFLLEDDLQITTLDDRLKMQNKWASRFDNGADWFTQKSDIVRRLEDKNGDGLADATNVFADGFNGPLDGLGSGLIARDGKVWYTCIPNLWLLRDDDADGKAEKKTSLLRGFGVNAAFYGHDLHGLVWGPDGRLYFSVGDRGAHVTTQEGNTISNPRNGAVFRCFPDGSGLEMIHRGLRNPQELAFDQFGNLFADDNNCDKGDDSRLVYIVPGGNSGWNMAFQTIAEPYLTGPWHAEGMWRLSHKLQPAYITPPVGKLGAGPSGFVFSSGTSLPSRFRNHFFYCNYTGNGGVESFAVQAVGAGFKIVDHQDFCKPINASDVDFGYDGKMYIADYAGNPWDRKTSGGRIYTVFDKAMLANLAVKQTRRWFKTGFANEPTESLAKRLSHPDMRVRLQAQFTLSTRDDAIDVLLSTARLHANQLARLHAIWGLGQIARERQRPKLLTEVSALLRDGDAEVRSQAAKLLGECQHQASAGALLELLSDPSLRVRFFAAIALGELKYKPAIGPIFKMLAENDGQDRYVVHAGVVALERIGDRAAVQQRAPDKSAAIRMAVLLVQRRWKDAQIVQFLDDADLRLVSEAARAIHDLPLPSCSEALAGLAERYRRVGGDDFAPLMRRIVNANFQLGRPKNVSALVRIAGSAEQSSVTRAEALTLLQRWTEPHSRDRVTGYWRPVPARDDTIVRQTVQAAASHLLSSTSGKLQTQVAGLLTKLNVETDDKSFARWVTDEGRSADARIAALRLLVARKYADFPTVLARALESSDAKLRAEARDQLMPRDEQRAVRLFAQVLDSPQSTILEKQRALAGLARSKTQDAASTLDAWGKRLGNNKVEPALQLDLIEALDASPTRERAAAVAAFHAAATPNDALSAYRTALAGGSAETGRELFQGHRTAQCVRCHTVNGDRKTAGPNLATVLRKENRDRRHLLQSIVNPNAQISKGYGAVTLILKSGQVVGGSIVAEDNQTITILTPAQVSMRIMRDNIEQQSATLSAMPDMTKQLSMREIRDLVEYLSTLR